MKNFVLHCTDLVLVLLISNTTTFCCMIYLFCKILQNFIQFHKILYDEKFSINTVNDVFFLQFIICTSGARLLPVPVAFSWVFLLFPYGAGVVPNFLQLFLPNNQILSYACTVHRDLSN